MTWIYLPENCESYPFSQDTGVTASDFDSLASIPEPSAMSRTIPLPSKSCNSVSETVWMKPQSGTTSRPSIPDPGEDTLTSSRQGSLASPILKPGHVGSPKDLTMTGISGPRHLNVFGWWDANGSCLRTYQASYLETTDGKPTLAPYLENLPRWGSVTFDGEFIRHAKPVLPTCGRDGGSWHIPTPTTADVYTGNMKSSQQSDGSMHSVSLPDYVEMNPTPGSQGTLNPTWVEQHLMSLPDGWTRLMPLPDGAYQEWFQAMQDRTWWDTERGSPNRILEADERKERLKILGNGIVPASAALAINEMRRKLCSVI